MRLTLVTPPQSEPVSLSEAKDHLRELDADQDSLIGSLIVAARAYVEELTGRALMTQTWRLDLDCFPSGDYWGGKIELPRPKLQSVTSVAYYQQSDGVLTTIDSADYTVTLGGEFERGFVVPAYQDSWPIPRDVPGAVRVTYVAGYASAEDVPQPIKQYMLLLIGSMYENREADAEKAVARLQFVDALLTPYRMFAF